MEVGRHEDKTGSGGLLENGQKHADNMELGEMVDLEMGVCEHARLS